MKIIHKVTALVVVALVGLTLAALVGSLGMDTLRGDVESLVQQEFVPLIEEDVTVLNELNASVAFILNADRDAYQALVAERASLEATTAEQWQDAQAGNQENAEQVEQRMDKAAAGLTGARAELYRRFQQEYAQWVRLSGQVVAQSQDPQTRDAARRLSDGDSAAAFGAMRGTMDEICTLQEEAIAAATARARQRQDAAMKHAQTTRQVAEGTMGTFLAVAAVTAGVVLVLGALVGRSIVRPLSLLVTRLRGIAEGDRDLTQRVEVRSKDEVGALAKHFNTFVEKVHDIVVRFADAAQDVASASTEIAASTEQMAEGMRQQAQQVARVSEGVEEMSRSVVGVARQSSEATTLAEQAGQAALEGGQVVRQTVDGMGTIHQAVSASAGSVEELGKRSEQIGRIVAVINEIADQTNLLALNAAIEAARAGEHGRGFAVVADEVRKLADRTTTATGEIGESIQAIQSETAQAVQRMQAGTQQVNRGVEQANTAGASLERIVAGAGRVVETIRTIAQAAEEQSEAADRVGRSLESINGVIRQATQGAEQAAKATTELSAKAEQLQGLVGQFRLATRRS